MYKYIKKTKRKTAEQSDDDDAVVVKLPRVPAAVCATGTKTNVTASRTPDVQQDRAVQALNCDDDTEHIVSIGGAALMTPNAANLSIQLTNSQRVPFDKVFKEGKSVFIGGAAGTGKTTLSKLLIALFRRDLLARAKSALAVREAKGQTLSLNQLVEFRRGVSVMSAEWKPARELDKFGTTIHTGLGLAVGKEHLLFNPDGSPTELGLRVIRKIVTGVLYGKAYRYPHIVIFEECSKALMSLINVIDRIYQCVRDTLRAERKALMFQKGGRATKLPVYVFLGDQYQLPPILKSGEPLCDNIFFMSNLLQQCIASSTAFYLNASIRHKYLPYFEFLERVKRGNETPADLELIASKTVKIDDPRLQSAVHVCALKETVKRVGDEFFAKLHTPPGEVRHTFRRFVAFKENEKAGDYGESFRIYKEDYERNNTIDSEVILCPGTYVRVLRPILIDKDKKTAEKDIVPTNTVGYVTGMLVDKVKGVTGVRFRSVKHMDQEDVRAVLGGRSLEPTENDVLISVTQYTDDDPINGHSVRDVFIPLAHAYAVTMQSVQGISHCSGYFAVHAYEAWMRQQEYVVLSRLFVECAADLDRLLIIGRFSRVKQLDPCIPSFDSKLIHLH